MPSVLRDDQHELLSPDESLSLLFGTEDTGYLTLSPPSYSAIDSRNGDVEQVREDGVRFGRDYLAGKSATYEMGVLTDKNTLDPHRANEDALDALEATWTDPRLRRGPGTYAILRSQVAGRVARAHGRPRRFEDTPGRLTRKGYTPVVCDFLIMDGLWYDDNPSSITLSTNGNDATYLTISGTRPTWITAEFTDGSSPVVDLGDFTIALNESLTNGTSVTVDPTPWNRSVLRSDGESRAGSLTAPTPPLRKLQLPPGVHWVSYSGGGSVTLRWRNARSRP